MMALQVIGGFTCLELGVFIPVVNPLVAQFDLALFGQFGLGGLLADFQLQFSAAFQATLQLGVQISDPIAALKAQLAALIQLKASLEAALSLSLPSLNVEVNLALSANLALMAGLGLKIGGIKLLLEAGIGVKLPLINLIAGLNIGPVFLLTFEPDGGTPNLSAVGTSIQSMFAAGFADPGDPGTHLNSTDPVYGICLVMKDANAYAALGTMLKTS